MSFYQFCKRKLLTRSILRNLSTIRPRNGSDAKSVNQSLFARNFSTNRNKSTKSWIEWKDVLTRFMPVGVCLVAVMQWRAYRRRHDDHVARQWEITCYCLLPLRTVSKCWGWLADKQLPEFLRPCVYQLYSNTFGVNVSEALNQDFKSYSSLADFFARALKDGVRSVDTASCLVAPCDGTVLHFGTIQNGEVEQVKGVTYSLKNFLGENSWKKDETADFNASLLRNPEKNSTLYQCVIYLAPGDYHRFHSPTEWTPTHRRHFSGELLSVNPRIAKWLPGLFCLNERAVYLGNWMHGFFSYTAVGATNVGTVKVYFDKNLQTNSSKKTRCFKEVCLGNSIKLNKGDIIGEFRMGSTIVLIFEAPTNFNFFVKSGDKVKMGQALGCLAQQKFVDRIEQKTEINVVT